DARFPGAVCYSIAQVDAALRSVSGRDDGDANEAARGAGRLLANLVHARPEEVIASLHAYLTGIVEDCGALHGAIVRTFFSHFAWVDFFNILPPHETLRLVSEATVITMPRDPFERVDLTGGDWPLLQDEELRGRCWEYLQRPHEPDVAEAASRLAGDLRCTAGDG